MCNENSRRSDSWSHLYRESKESAFNMRRTLGNVVTLRVLVMVSLHTFSGEVVDMISCRTRSNQCRCDKATICYNQATADGNTV
jgi:hypothetical protein